MSNRILTIQYLEDSPALVQLDRKSVINKLRQAAECLPLTHLLIGWNVPLPLLEACRKEAEHLGMRFIRWQPLLTTDKGFQPDPAWQTEGLKGSKVPGYRGLPEFTFFCPNHPAVREALYNHLVKLIRQGMFQGFFLDRVRFPSPSTFPINDLACFCEHCQHKATEDGFDLREFRGEILRQTQDEEGSISLIKSLLSRKIGPDYLDQSLVFSQFLAFRKRCVRDFLAFITQPLRVAHLEVGLDCFSPSLTNLVGQDLVSLSELVDWIKLMTYAHTFAPAGIPYELSGLVHYLSTRTNLREEQALDWMGETIGLQLPKSCRSLEKDGLSTSALEEEVRQGGKASSTLALAGIELVELVGVTRLKPDQIRSDLIAIKRAQPAGLALSWDLVHIPLESLELVRQVYFRN